MEWHLMRQQTWTSKDNVVHLCTNKYFYIPLSAYALLVCCKKSLVCGQNLRGTVPAQVLCVYTFELNWKICLCGNLSLFALFYYHKTVSSQCKVCFLWLSSPNYYFNNQYFLNKKKFLLTHYNKGWKIKINLTLR